MKQTMKTGFLRELGHTRGRFISIMLLMFLSTFTLVGLKLVGPDIRMMANEYLDQYQLADLSVISTYGLEESDIQKLDTMQDAQVEYGYFTDVTIDQTDEAIRLYSNHNQISQFELVSGSMPTETDQIAISDQMKEKYPLDSEITVIEKGSKSDQVLTEHTFTVVGYVNSLEILSTMDLGATNVGTGTLTGYGVTAKQSFDSEVYMIARMYFDDLRNEDAFLNDYLEEVASLKSEVEDLLEDQPQARLSKIKTDAEAEIEENLKKLEDGEAELDQAKVELSDAKIELEDAANKLADAKVQLDDALVEINNGQNEIDEGFAALEDAEAELLLGKQELDSNQQTLTESKQQVNEGFSTIESQQVEIDNGYQELVAAQSEIDSARSELTAGKDQYEA